jgi:polyisoprenoid-binding protein YceI
MEHGDELVRGSDAHPGGVFRQAHCSMSVKGAFTGVSAAIDFNEDDFTASAV